MRPDERFFRQTHELTFSSPPLNHHLWLSELIKNSTVFIYQLNTNTHKVLRNVGLIIVATPDFTFSLCLLSKGTKSPSQRLTFKNSHTYSHSLTIKRTGPPWSLLAFRRIKNSQRPALLPPERASLAAPQQPPFLFVPFVQLLGSVGSPLPCQLKTCVSC